MPELLECRGSELYELGKELADAGASLHIEVRGWSMYPIIRNGDKIHVSPVAIDDINVGDVVFFRSGDRLLAHRVVGHAVDSGCTSLRTRGDRFRHEDPPFGQAELIGKVVIVSRTRGGSQRVVRLDRGPAKYVGLCVARSRVAHHCFRWAAYGMHRFENLTVKLGRSLLSLVIALLFCALIVVRGDAQSTAGQDADIRALTSDQNAVVLVVDVPELTVTRKVIGATDFDVPSVSGWGLTQEVGAPQLPMRRILVGIPQDARFQLEVLTEVVREVGPYHVMPVPDLLLQTHPMDQLGPWNTPPRFEERFHEDPNVYSTDAEYPGIVARVVDVAYIRDHRVAVIELYPAQYNPVSHRMWFHSRFRLKLSFSYPLGQVPVRSSDGEVQFFDRLLSDQLVNYAGAGEWRGTAAACLTSESWPLASEAYKVLVAQDGIHRLTYQGLWAAGVPVATLDPRTLQIYSMGGEIAIRVLGEEDGRFDEGDYVLFYGQGFSSKYSNENVYWLTYGQAVGRRMSNRDGAPSSSFPSPSFFEIQLRLEENRRYSSQWPGDDATDRWFWEGVQVYPDEPVDLAVDADLGHVYASSEEMTSTLRISMKGHNEAPGVNPDHHARFFVNSCYVGEHWWDGAAEVQYVELEVPQRCLVSGVNVFRSTFPGDTGLEYELVLFDWYELSFAHAFQADLDRLAFTQATSGTWTYDITDFSTSDVEIYDVSIPMSVTRIISPTVESAGSTFTLRFSDVVSTTKTYLTLTPDRFLAPETLAEDLPATPSLHDTTNAADYIIISHTDFMPAAERLATYKAGQGLRTVAVDIVDVYDEFSYGLAIPQAIRDFIRFAYEHWERPAPQYVLLLGDGTYDPKNYVDSGVVNYIPPYLAFVDRWMGETATDNWYVAVSGDDILPDLALGRLPTNSLTEANLMVDRIIGYEQDTQVTDWNSRLTFVAGRQPDPKGAGDFHDLSEEVIDGYVPPFYDISRVYLGAVPGSTCGSGSECRQKLIDAINAGTLLVNFIGHGSVVQWDGERILDLEAIDQLTNASRLPVMLPMTCLEGKFTNPYPQSPSISETVVRATAGGAVASWGPTGLGVAYGHDQLNRGFLDAVFARGIRELGLATLAGKLRLYGAGYSLEQVQEYTLFGDPALRMHVRDADLQIGMTLDGPREVMPRDVLTFTLSFTNAGPGIAHNVVLTDLLPSVLASPTVVFADPAVISQHVDLTFSWALTHLWPHTGGEMQIRAVVDPAAVPPITILASAEITASTPDLAPWNNRAWLGIGVERLYLPLVLRRVALGGQH